MKILLVTQYFWPEYFVINSLATELQQRGHQVTVLTGLPNYPQGKFFPGYSLWRGPWRENYHGVQVIRVPLLPRGAGFLRLALNYLSFVFFGLFPGVWSVPGDLDVIFCFALSPITLALPAVAIKKIQRIPLILWVQDLWPESLVAVGAARGKIGQTVVKLVGAMVAFIYRRCDVILMQSQAFRSSILRWGGQDSQLSYLPNWFVDSEPQNPPPAWLQELPVGFKIVFAGNFGKAQDLANVLAAARILREHSDIHWVLVGDGSEKQFLEKSIAENNLHHQVHLFGRRPVEDMPALFAASDVLLTTLTPEFIFTLTIPGKVQAYLSSGKPIIAAIDGEGGRIITEAAAGLAVPASHPEELAAAVLQIKNSSSAEREKMGANGRAYFEENFTKTLIVDQIVAKMEALWLKI